jgi:hypothetical protein
LPNGNSPKSRQIKGCETTDKNPSYAPEPTELPVRIVTVTVVDAVTVDVMLFVEVHVLSADPDKPLPVELARDFPELANASETAILPVSATVGAADSLELPDDS